LVRVNAGADGYDMVNRETGVIEGENKSLPTLVSEAEQSNCYLIHQTWQWIRRQSETDNSQAVEVIGLNPDSLEELN
jgi:hypothetical protein